MRFIERALDGLRKEIRLERISSIYETQPVGVRDQPWFLNLVCIGFTRFKPRALLEYTQRIEDLLGRRRGGERFGPRTIDIDILLYEEDVVSEEFLEIPHPRLTERRFVLEPLNEVAPDWRHPVEGKKVSELLKEVNGDVVRPYMPPPPLRGAGPIL